MLSNVQFFLLLILLTMRNCLLSSPLHLLLELTVQMWVMTRVLMLMLVNMQFLQKVEWVETVGRLLGGSTICSPTPWLEDSFVEDTQDPSSWVQVEHARLHHSHSHTHQFRYHDLLFVSKGAQFNVLEVIRAPPMCSNFMHVAFIYKNLSCLKLKKKFLLMHS